MSEHITGDRARELFDAAETPPPWQVERQETPQGHVSQVVGPVEKTQMTFDFLPVVATNLTETDAALTAAAPDLAATVAWLYGREPGDSEYNGPHVHVTSADGITVWVTGDEVRLDGRYIDPDAAVDLARALLEAAERARTEGSRAEGPDVQSTEN